MVGMRSVRQDGGESLWIGHSYPYEGPQEEWLLRKAMSRNTRPLLWPLNRAYVDVLVGEGYCPAMSGGECDYVLCAPRWGESLSMDQPYPYEGPQEEWLLRIKR